MAEGRQQGPVHVEKDNILPTLNCTMATDAYELVTF